MNGHLCSQIIAQQRSEVLLGDVVLTAAEAQALVGQLAVEHWSAVVVDAAVVADTESLLRLLGEIWQLPSYYGVNWSALVDCLTDGNRPAVTGFALIVLHAQRWQATAPELFSDLTTAFDIIDQRWRERRPGPGAAIVLADG